MAIGNPFGLDHTVTLGIVSAKGRFIGSGPFDDFIQTDAPINPGNSGGPLLDLQGKVVGVNSAIVASGQGIGFAIPSELAEEVIAQLKDHKSVARGWLGVGIQAVDDNAAKALGLTKAQGALVTSVDAEGPAAKAGFRVGDVILEVNGNAVADANDLVRKITDYAPGDPVEIRILRNSDRQTLAVELGLRDLSTIGPDKDSPGDAAEGSVLGMRLQPVGADEAKALGLDGPQGLLVAELEPSSPADEAGVRAGDVILEANMKPVNAVGELEAVVKGDGKAKGVVMLLLNRRGENLFRTIEIAESSDKASRDKKSNDKQ